MVLLSLFSGFIVGNLFGTFLDTLRLYLFWNGFIGFFILFFMEAVNSLAYGTSFSRKYSFINLNSDKLKFLSKNVIHIKRALNSFKIGLLFGFFVDSFKVGS